MFRLIFDTFLIVCIFQQQQNMCMRVRVCSIYIEFSRIRVVFVVAGAARLLGCYAAVILLSSSSYSE